MNTIIVEIARKIADVSDARDLHGVSCVNRHWYHIIRDDKLYCERYNQALYTSAMEEARHFGFVGNDDRGWFVKLTTQSAHAESDYCLKKGLFTAKMVGYENQHCFEIITRDSAARNVYRTIPFHRVCNDKWIIPIFTKAELETVPNLPQMVQREWNGTSKIYFDDRFLYLALTKVRV